MDENPLKRHRPTKPNFAPIPYVEPNLPPPVFQPIIRPTIFGVPDIIWQNRWNDFERERWIQRHHYRQQTLARCKRAGIVYDAEETERREREFIANHCSLYIYENDEIDNFKV